MDGAGLPSDGAGPIFCEPKTTAGPFGIYIDLLRNLFLRVGMVRAVRADGFEGPSIVPLLCPAVADVDELAAESARRRGPPSGTDS